MQSFYLLAILFSFFMVEVTAAEYPQSSPAKSFACFTTPNVISATFEWLVKGTKGNLLVAWNKNSGAIVGVRIGKLVRGSAAGGPQTVRQYYDLAAKGNGRYELAVATATLPALAVEKIVLPPSECPIKGNIKFVVVQNS